MRAIVRAYLFWKLPKVQTKENVFLLNWWPLTFWLSRLQWNGCVDFPYFALQFLFIVIVQYNFPKLNARCINFVALSTCNSVSFHICSKLSSFYDTDFRQDPPKEKIFPCSRKVFTLSFDIFYISGLTAICSDKLITSEVGKPQLILSSSIYKQMKWNVGDPNYI